MRTYMRSGALKALLKSVECYEVNSPVPLQTGGRLVLFSTREQLQRSSSLVLFFFSFKFSLLSLSLSLSLPLLFHISLPCFINCSSAALSFWTSRYCAIVAAKAEMVLPALIRPRASLSTDQQRFIANDWCSRSRQT